MGYQPGHQLGRTCGELTLTPSTSPVDHPDDAARRLVPSAYCLVSTNPKRVSLAKVIRVSGGEGRRCVQQVEEKVEVVDQVGFQSVSSVHFSVAVTNVWSFMEP